MKISIVVPCYNEENNIKNIITVFQNLNFEIAELELILVQNGSKDNTAGMLRKYSEGLEFIKIVDVPINLGYGYGIKQGLKVATGDYVGWLHADLQVEPKEIMPFVEKVQNCSLNEKVFCKGIRSNRNFTDHFFTFSMSVFESILFGSVLFDIGAIPVLFSRSFLPILEVAPNDFSIELFSYLMAKKKGYQIVREKIHMEDRKNGESSWNHGVKSKFLQSYKIMKASLQIRFKKKGD